MNIFLFWFLTGLEVICVGNKIKFKVPTGGFARRKTISRVAFLSTEIPLEQKKMTKTSAGGIYRLIKGSSIYVVCGQLIG